jgi:phytoene/squalene synthetase
LYEGILQQIETAGYNVFNRRAAVSAAGKLSRLPGIWWRVRRIARQTGPIT